MQPPDFDPAYLEPLHMPGDPVVVVASGERTVVARVILVKLFGEPILYAYIGLDGRCYGASELRPAGHWRAVE
jgi:hypothetical protein